MGHPRFKTNKLLAQRINKSEEYARQLRESTQQELKKFFDNHDETDSEDLEYAVKVISTKCKDMVGINE
jgi:predicted house-cleaning noncanonical NTP pyrophosphatase (MazG superfamily)